MTRSRKKTAAVSLALSIALLSGASGAVAATNGEPGPVAPIEQNDSGLMTGAVANPDSATGVVGSILVIDDIHLNDTTFDASKDVLVDETGATVEMVDGVAKQEIAKGTKYLFQTGATSTRFEFHPKAPLYVGQFDGGGYYSRDFDGATARGEINLKYIFPGFVLANAVAENDEATGTNGENARVENVLGNDRVSNDGSWKPYETIVFDLKNPWEKYTLAEGSATIPTAEGIATVTVTDEGGISAELDSTSAASATSTLRYLPIDTNNARGIADITLTVLPAEVPDTAPEVPAEEVEVPDTAPEVPTEEEVEVPVTSPEVPTEEEVEVPVTSPEVPVKEVFEIDASSSAPVTKDQMAKTPGQAVASETSTGNEGSFELIAYALSLVFGMGAVIARFASKQTA